MQGLTQAFAKAKLLIPAFKAEGFTELWLFSRVTVVFAGVENFQRNKQGIFAEGMQFIVPTYWFFFFGLATPVRWHQDVFTW